MALVNIDTVFHEIKRILRRSNEKGGVEILSYKRNRTVAIIKEENGRVTVREKGYQENEWVFTEEELPRKLKSIFKREFPRSRKLRLFKFSDPKQLGRIHQKI